MLRKAIAAALLIWSVASAARAQELAPLPPQPAGLAWPTQDWETAPLPRGLDRPAFDLAVTQAFAGPDPLMGETRAVLIVQGGRIVFERYGEGISADTRLISWSMAKSVTQALVGAAVLQGRLGIDEPMGNPHWRAGDRRASITWRQWLNMVDGQAWDEMDAARITDNGSARMLFGAGRGGIARFAARQPLAHDPGTHWNYNSGAVALEADALTRLVVPDPRDATDRRQRMRAWMDASLFAPIGMHPIIEFDAQGLFYGSASMWANARDWARFGYLYLRGGVWDGTRVLPEGWVDFARRPGPAPNTDTYGAGWWLTAREGPGRPYRSLITDTSMADAFSAQGHEGQITVVAPSKDLVLVRLGIFDDTDEAWDALGDWTTRIIGAFSDRPAT